MVLNDMISQNKLNPSTSFFFFLTQTLQTLYIYLYLKICRFYKTDKQLALQTCNKDMNYTDT